MVYTINCILCCIYCISLCGIQARLALPQSRLISKASLELLPPNRNVNRSSGAQPTQLAANWRIGELARLAKKSKQGAEAAQAEKWKTTLAATVLGKKSAKVKVHAAGACYASPEPQAEPRAVGERGVRGCTAIKRGFAPINRRCESPPRARVASCTCNFNAHVEQPFETFVVAFAFGFFRGSQIKNVNKQGGVRGVRNRPKAVYGSFCSTHIFCLAASICCLSIFCFA